MVQGAVPTGFALRSLRAFGFEGFVSVATLRQPKCTVVPRRGPGGQMQGGVYVAYRQSSDPPRFLAVNPSGRWRGDRTLPLAELQRHWTPRSHVVYIGKADATATNNLRRRVSAYLRFGAGSNARHAGGCRTWQLADSAELLIGWMIVPDGPPLRVEDRLLAAHVARFGQLPFAND